MSGPRDPLPKGSLEPAFMWPEELQDEPGPDRPRASWPRIIVMIIMILGLIAWWI